MSEKSHLEDKPPSRPLPSPAARSEPQGLVARPSRGPWPSRTWPSLWPPPSTNPQSLGIPIKSQPHPSQPHHSEKKTRSYNDNRYPFAHCCEPLTENCMKVCSNSEGNIVIVTFLVLIECNVRGRFVQKLFTFTFPRPTLRPLPPFAGL